MTDQAVFPRLASLAGRLVTARGWKRLGLAALAGALATLSLPPLHALPLLWVAFPALVWLLRGSDRPKTDFTIGLAFAIGHHVPGLYWISAALFTDIGRFWFMLPASLLGLPAVLGLFLGVGTVAYGWARRRWGLTGWVEAAGLALAWVAVEYARGHMFTGFPWNLIGYGWVPVLPVLQTVSVIGIYGLSLLTVLAAALPATLVATKPSWRPALAGLLGLALLAGWGGWRMAGQGLGDVPDVRLRIVQPNIPQALKWKEEAKINNLRRLIDMSGAEGWDRVTHVIWPETAVPYFLSSDSDNPDQAPLTRLLTQIAPPGGALITGANRLATNEAGDYIYFNSLFALTQGGTVVASFDKAHLVPFGEYLPLRGLLPKGVKAVAAAADFSAGPGPRAVSLPGAPAASPLICYEVIFPGAVMPREGERPHWLLNLTNDAWYGQTAGPHQHFAITAVRAVEEGVPLVRAANTGISGVIDAYGRVRGALPLGDSGNLDISLPQRAETVPLYADYGDAVPVVIWLALLLGIAAFRPRPT
ncbi:apolipoprotein N-acyltransferase [Niveispirillum sp. KHB5.9]|uniref:apolipoprotein N-acyltransferase n=1 Tax=Niveispirillum sp. KHB5.9 TaxID=3400269 RepID=UPI003A86D5DC